MNINWWKLTWITGIFLLVFGFWVVVSLAVHELASRSDTTSFSDAAAFGDSFGAVNALFAGFAFAGMIIALYLQRQQFKEQQEQNRVVILLQKTSWNFKERNWSSRDKSWDGLQTRRKNHERLLHSKSICSGSLRLFRQQRRSPRPLAGGSAPRRSFPK